MPTSTSAAIAGCERGGAGAPAARAAARRCHAAAASRWAAARHLDAKHDDAEPPTLRFHALFAARRRARRRPSTSQRAPSLPALAVTDGLTEAERRRCRARSLSSCLRAMVRQSAPSPASVELAAQAQDADTQTRDVAMLGGRECPRSAVDDLAPEYVGGYTNARTSASRWATSTRRSPTTTARTSWRRWRPTRRGSSSSTAAPPSSRRGVDLALADVGAGGGAPRPSTR